MKMQLAAAVLALALGAGGVAAAPEKPTLEEPSVEKGYSHWTKVNGHRMYYELRGTGRPLLLLHGGGSTIEDSFGYQLGPFAAAHHIIAPEQVGHGHTPDVPGPLSYTRMTEDTARLLQQLHLSNVDVMGFSDGGIIALMLALRHPDLVRRLVVTGANLDPSGLTDAGPEDTQAREADLPMNPRARAHYAAESPDGPGHADVMDDKLTQLWLHYPAKDELSPEMLKGLHKRVLVMSGDRDQIKLEHTMLIYQSLPDAQLWILPGTEHATFSARPQWVNAVVSSFLDEP